MLENAGEKAHNFRTRVRYGQKRLKRLSRTATLGGIFLSFLEIGLTGFGGGLAVISLAWCRNEEHESQHTVSARAH